MMKKHTNTKKWIAIIIISAIAVAAVAFIMTQQPALDAPTGGGMEINTPQTEIGSGNAADAA